MNIKDKSEISPVDESGDSFRPSAIRLAPAKGPEGLVGRVIQDLEKRNAGQIAALEALLKYRNERRNNDLSVFKKHIHDGLPLEENEISLSVPEPRISQAIDIKALRKTIVSIMLEKHDLFMRNFRFHFVKSLPPGVKNRQQETVMVGEVAHLVFSDAFIESNTFLGEEKKKEMNPYNAERSYGFDFVAKCLYFPLDVDDRVNIYKKEDLETFYGHLISAISGLGMPVYRSYQERLEEINLDLPEFPMGPLPSEPKFGKYLEQINIALLQESMAAKIQAALHGEEKRPDIPLLPFFENTTGMEASLKDFGKLPVENSFWKRIEGVIFGLTKESYLTRHRRQFPVSPEVKLLMEAMEKLLALYDFPSAGGTELVRELHRLKYREFEKILKTLNSQTDDGTTRENLADFIKQTSSLLAYLGKMQHETEHGDTKP